MPVDDPLKEYAQYLTVSEKTYPHPRREGSTPIFNNLLSEKLEDEKLKAKLENSPRSENVTGLQAPKFEPFNLEPAYNYYRSLRCKIAKGAKPSYWRSITAMGKAFDWALGRYGN